MREVDVASNASRLLLIGDSLTECLGYRYDDTFAGVIDHSLKDNHLKDVKVLNAAMASYCAVMYWRKIKYLIEEVGFEFDRLAVYIDISDAEGEGTFYRLADGEMVVDKNPPAGDDGEAPSKSFKKRLKDSVSVNSILFVGVYKSYLRGLFPRACAAVGQPWSL